MRPLITAWITSKLLPHCQLRIREDGVHFSQAALDDFIKNVVTKHYQGKE